MGSSVPKLPMPPTDTDIYDKNTREQYEALGRFVEAFERMVHELRGISIEILQRDNDKHADLVAVPFHHYALTAKPQFEIMRALVAELLTQKFGQLSVKERDTFFSVLAVIAGEYSKLSEIRNNLLHGTWFIGFMSYEDPNAANFTVNKYKTTKIGLMKEEVPKDAAELLNLRDRCDKVLNWLAFMRDCLPLPNHTDKICDFFKLKNGRWHLIFRDLPPETMP